MIFLFYIDSKPKPKYSSVIFISKENIFSISLEKYPKHSYKNKNHIFNSDIMLRKKNCGIPTEFKSLERVDVLAHANQSTCKWPLVKLSSNVGSKLNHLKLCIFVNIFSFVNFAKF